MTGRPTFADKNIAAPSFLASRRSIFRRTKAVQSSDCAKDAQSKTKEDGILQDT